MTPRCVCKKRDFTLWILLSQYDQDLSDQDRLQAYVLNTNFFPHHMLMPLNHRFLSRNLQYSGDRSKPWVASPAKRNSELINSLLGLPKNMESAGK